MKLNSEKIHKGFILFLRLTILLAMITEIINSRWALLFITTIIFILTFIPDAFEKKYKIDLPIEFEAIIIAFIYASLFLGEIHAYYTTYWWWDAVLHISSGIGLGFIGFLILYILYQKEQIKAHPAWIAIFAFSFAMAIGAVWEIFEFSMDQLFGFNMQKSGLIDTMWDLIVDAIGALITSIIGYYYLKGKKTPLFTRLVEKFAKDNKKRFT